MRRKCSAWSRISEARQVAREAHAAGRAERARQRAARLRGDADRAPPVAVAHQHRLQRPPVGGREQRLDGAVARACLARAASGSRTAARAPAPRAARRAGRSSPHSPRRPAPPTPTPGGRESAARRGRRASCRAAARSMRRLWLQQMRLAKYLAHAGVASRRAAEALIAAGRVSGRRASSSPTPRATWTSDEPRGARRAPARRSRAAVLYALNKPVGVVSTARDTHGRPTVVELVPARGLRLYPVGRLDADSSGLILLTNDGELANRLTHPRFEVPKTYRARVGGRADRRRSALRAAARRRDARGRPHRAGARAPRRAARALDTSHRADDPRGTQPPGAPHVRGGRPPRARAAARSRFGPLRLGRSRPARTGASARPRSSACAAAGGRPMARSDTIAANATVRPARRHQRRAQRRPGHPRRHHRADAARSCERNALAPEHVVSCIFTATSDLNAEFPAVAARALGFEQRAAAVRAGDPRAAARCRA